MVWAALLMLGGLGLVFGLGLAIAARFFTVEEDPRVQQVYELLPGLDCGVCGFAGCRSYAEAVLKGKIGPGECAVGGQRVHDAVAAALAMTAQAKERLVAVLRCNGRDVADRFALEGIPDCRAAALLHGGPKACRYGCIGLSTCAQVCPVSAIVIENGFPRVLEERCIACRACVRACPKNLFVMRPLSRRVQVLCSSQDKGSVVRHVCAVGCIACKRCEKVCPADAVHVQDFLADIDPEKCTLCGLCIKECPTGTIQDLREGVRKTGKTSKESAEASVGLAA
jgi:Na+-translocating ferredoxin:NAD+ oxidoreductase RNF subunit RnfB